MPPLSPTLVTLLWQGSLVLFCALEESLQFSSPLRSRVLYGFVALLLDVAVSVLRFPVRVLVVLGLCHASSLEEFSRVVPGITEFLSLRTEESVRAGALIAVTEAELKRERLRNAQFNRMQVDLERSQADRARYQRESVTLQVQRDELAAEKSQVQQALGDRSKAYDIAVQEREQLSRILSEQTAKLEVATKCINDLAARLRRSEDARAKAQNSLADLTDVRRQLDRDLFRTQSEVLDFRQSLKREQAASRVRLTLHKGLFRRMLLVLWVLRSFTRHLGNRVARQHGTINALKIQFKVLRNARIDASREATLYQRRNGELVAQVEFLGGEADRWRIRCNEHRVKRQAAARQFTQFLILVASRRSTANSRLITGLLTLWRLNLILSERLARATRRVRTLNRWPALGGALDPSENGIRRTDAGTQCDGEAFASEASAAQANKVFSPSAERSELGAEWTWNELLPVSTGPHRSDATVQWEGPHGRVVHTHASTQYNTLETTRLPPLAQSSDADGQCETPHLHNPEPTQLSIESERTPVPAATLRTIHSPALSDSSSIAGTDDNNIDDLYEDLAGLDNPPLMTFGSLQDIGAVGVTVDTDETLDSLETISSFSPNGPLSTIAEEEEMSEVGSIRSSVRSRKTSAVDAHADVWHHLHSGVANFDAEVDAAFQDPTLTTPVNIYQSPMQNGSVSTPIRLVPRKELQADDTPRVILVQKEIQTDSLSEPEVPSVLTARLQQLWERIEAMQHWSQEYRSLALIHTHPTVCPPDIVFGSSMVLPPQDKPGSTFDEASEPPQIWPKTSIRVKDDDHPIGAHLAGDPKRSLRSSMYAQ